MLESVSLSDCEPAAKRQRISDDSFLMEPESCAWQCGDPQSLGHFETNLDLHDVDDLCFDINPEDCHNFASLHFDQIHQDHHHHHYRHSTSSDDLVCSPHLDYPTHYNTPQSSRSADSSDSFTPPAMPDFTPDFSNCKLTDQNFQVPLAKNHTQGAKSLLAAVQQQHQQHFEKFENVPLTMGTVSHLEQDEGFHKFYTVRSSELPQISIAFSPHQLSRLSNGSSIDQIELPPPAPAPRASMVTRNHANAPIIDPPSPTSEEELSPVAPKKQTKRGSSTASKAAKAGSKLTRRFCHICRSPKDLSRIVTCGSGKQSHVFCSSCVQRRLDLNFEELLRNRDWLCPKCHNRCPCSKCRPKRAPTHP